MATKRIAKKPAKKTPTTTEDSQGTPRREQASATQAAERVTVRMYRQGLGDCFLISFPGQAGGPFHMLIDCGVVLGTSEPVEKMKRVLDNIAEVTHGQIDLLVATHEHWDHVSGFSASQVQDQFDKLTIGQVWVAWTEDLSDPLANKLRAERRIAENALRMAVTHLAMAEDRDTAQRVDSLVSFFGASAGSTAEALDYIKKRGSGGKARYCKPGEPPIAVSGLDGVRFWILGPPKDERLIKKSNPAQNEAYGLDAAPGGSEALLVSGLARGIGVTLEAPADETLEDPFDSVYSIPISRAEHVPFFENSYFGDSTDGSLYDKSTGKAVQDQSWRRIDSAWMGASETMALQLDSATNNTSLVIAIELTATGDVLLFPGDAQAGNWLSWQDLKWEFVDQGAKKAVTGPDLLARTVFYKVGHHGSHNATLKTKGLELMVNEGLIAMIPVDHAMAVKKRWGRMPLPELVSRIQEKAHGRVLRVDDDVRTQDDLAKLKPLGTSAADWKAFTNRVQVTDLFYQVSF